MFNHQYSSFNVILDRVKRGKLYKELTVESALAYVIDCMRLIGSNNLYITKPARIEIKNYRGKIPADMQYILQCMRMYIGNREQYETAYTSYSNQSYSYVNKTTGIQKCMWFLPMTYGTDNFHSIYHATNSPDLKYKAEYTYTLNNNYIQTNFEEGNVMMAYKAINTDTDGMPLIPDNSSVQMAIEFYIKWKFLEDSGSDEPFVERTMNKAEQQYCWYVGQAGTSMESLSMDEYESFANMMSKLYIVENQHGNRLNDLGMQEFVRIQD